MRETDGSTAAPAASCKNCLRWESFISPSELRARVCSPVSLHQLPKCEEEQGMAQRPFPKRRTRFTLTIACVRRRKQENAEWAPGLRLSARVRLAAMPAPTWYKPERT